MERREKYIASMIKKYGSEEKWKQANKEHASKGGKNGKGHKFAHGKVNPAQAGKLSWKNRV